MRNLTPPYEPTFAVKATPFDTDNLFPWDALSREHLEATKKWIARQPAFQALLTDDGMGLDELWECFRNLEEQGLVRVNFISAPGGKRLRLELELPDDLRIVGH